MTRRANALVFLDDGWSGQEVAKAFLRDQSVGGCDLAALDARGRRLDRQEVDRAVHPTHAARPAGGWVPGQEKRATLQTSGPQRINIHGAIDL